MPIPHASAEVAFAAVGLAHERMTAQVFKSPVRKGTAHPLLPVAKVAGFCYSGLPLVRSLRFGVHMGEKLPSW